MARFPSTEPSRRSFSFPAYPGQQESAWSGAALRREARLPDNRETLPNQPITITYEGITAVEVSQIRQHWVSTLHGTLAFLADDVIWPWGSGTLVGSTSAQRWRYASAPQEQQRKNGFYDVTIELVAIAAAAGSPVIAMAATAALIVRGLEPAVAAGGVSIFIPAAIVASNAPVPAVTAQDQTQVDLPSASPIITRAEVPTVAGLPSGVESPAAPVVIAALVQGVTNSIGGVLDTSSTTSSVWTFHPPSVSGTGVVIPEGVAIAAAPEPIVTSGGVGADPPVGVIVSLPPVPAIFAGAGTEPPAGPIISAAPAPGVDTAGVVIQPPVGPIVSPAPVPEGVVGVGVESPTGAIISTAPLPTIS